MKPVPSRVHSQNTFLLSAYCLLGSVLAGHRRPKGLSVNKGQTQTDKHPWPQTTTEQEEAVQDVKSDLTECSGETNEHGKKAGVLAGRGRLSGTEHYQRGVRRGYADRKREGLLPGKLEEAPKRVWPFGWLLKDKQRLPGTVRTAQATHQYRSKAGPRPLGEGKVLVLQQHRQRWRESKQEKSRGFLRHVRDSGFHSLGHGEPTEF